MEVETGLFDNLVNRTWTGTSHHRTRILARDDYKDPGNYDYPKGTVAYKVDAPPAEAPRQNKPKESAKPTEMKAMKGMKGMKGM